MRNLIKKNPPCIYGGGAVVGINSFLRYTHMAVAAAVAGGVDVRHFFARPRAITDCTAGAHHLPAGFLVRHCPPVLAPVCFWMSASEEQQPRSMWARISASVTSAQ